jgi:pyruvate formate lyase activating enzyme
MTDKTCQVFEIVRGTTHDGPGIRTTVFLKGCPLNCSWCQNPEGISVKPEIGWEAVKCIHCLDCVAACKTGALSDKDVRLVRDRTACTLCGACVEACPSHAMEFTSREWTLDSLVKEVLKDYDYYSAFGGGVTVSGGEPLCHYEFVSTFFKKLRTYNVHTALDTSGFAPKEAFDAVLPYTNQVLFDIKMIDDPMHIKYTGKSNKLILQNLIVIAERIRKSRNKNNPQSNQVIKLWIRTPLIPGVTATPENLRMISTFINEHLADVVERWELCTFNKICVNKYKKLNLKWVFEDVLLINQKTVEDLKKSVLSTGFDMEKLAISGLITN